MNRKARKRGVQILAGILLTGLGLWLSFRRLDWDIVKEAFLSIRPFWCLLALSNSLFLVYALGLRWRILLAPQKKVPLISLFRLNIIAQYVNIILPGRFGEILRAYLVSRRYGIPGGFSLGTVSIEKYRDSWVVLFLRKKYQN